MAKIDNYCAGKIATRSSVPKLGRVGDHHRGRWICPPPFHAEPMNDAVTRSDCMVPVPSGFIRHIRGIIGTCFVTVFEVSTQVFKGRRKKGIGYSSVKDLKLASRVLQLFITNHNFASFLLMSSDTTLYACLFSHFLSLVFCPARNL